MPEKNAYLLLEKIKNGTCTAEEKAIVESWYLQWKQENPADLSEQEFLASLQNIRSALPQHQTGTRRLYRISAVAAGLLLVFGLAFIFLKPAKEQGALQNHVVADFKPGGNKAILTLSNGKKISLDDQMDQQQLSGTEKNIIRKGKAKGELVYDATQENIIVNGDNAIANGTAGLSNTIVTPRAGQYKVILSDGTQVWLNAQSSIRFPVVFAAASREVEITGEAYFEVAKRTRTNPNRQQERIPFIVKTPKQQVEVLGTHFNINCYEDEASTNTTLLEGAVSVSLLHSAKNLNPVTYRLRPGQQSKLTGTVINVATVDAEEEVAWKNGTISFANADIKSIMRQVSRWYNVDVKYQGAIPARTFTGSIPRNSRLSELLKILKFSNINYSISGSQLTVLP